MNDKNETNGEKTWDHCCTVTASERRTAVCEAQLNWQSPTTQRHVTEYPVICHKHHHTTAQHQRGCSGGLRVGAVLPGHSHWYSSRCGESPFLISIYTHWSKVEVSSFLTHVTGLCFVCFRSCTYAGNKGTPVQLWCVSADHNDVYRFKRSSLMCMSLQNRPAPPSAAASVHIRPVRGAERGGTRAVVEGGGHKGSHT